MITLTITTSLKGPEKLKIVCKNKPHLASMAEQTFNYVLGHQLKDFLDQCRAEAERIIRVMKHEGRFRDTGKFKIEAERIELE